MAKEKTQEQIEFEKMQAEMLKKMQEEFNGCPLFKDREKGTLDELEGQELRIEDLYPIQDYHAIIFEGIQDKFFLTGGALKDLCNNYPPEFVAGRVIQIKPMVDTKSRRKFRPIEVIA